MYRFRRGAASARRAPGDRPILRGMEPSLDAPAIVDALDLRPHPEGGWFRETWRGPSGPDGRAAGTAIYFLVSAASSSAWHRLDAPEVWAWHAGAPLELRLSVDGAPVESRRLGGGPAAGGPPQAVVPAGAWQSARTLGAWTLVGCFMAPGFDPAGFELAPEGWAPPA